MVNGSPLPRRIERSKFLRLLVCISLLCVCAHARTQITASIVIIGALPKLGEQQNFLADLKGHDGPVWQVAWAHPKFDNLLASSSYDGNVIIWKETNNTWYVHPSNHRANPKTNSVLCVSAAYIFSSLSGTFKFVCPGQECMLPPILRPSAQ